MHSFPPSPLEAGDFPASYNDQSLALLQQIAGVSTGPPIVSESSYVYDTVSGGPAYLVVFDDGTTGYFSDPAGTTPLAGVIPGTDPGPTPPVIVTESNYVFDSVSNGPAYLVVFSDGTTGYYSDPQGTTPLPGVIPGPMPSPPPGLPIVSESNYVYDTVSGGPAYLVVFDDGTTGYYSDPQGTTPLAGVIPGDPPVASIPETPTTMTTVTGVNVDVPAGLESVTISNLTGTTTINGAFGIGENHSLSAISFGGERGNQLRELLPAYTLAGGTWEWIGHN